MAPGMVTVNILVLAVVLKSKMVAVCKGFVVNYLLTHSPRNNLVLKLSYT